MGTSYYRYPVRLSEEQHQWLEAMVRMGSTPAKHYLAARVLLMSDQSQVVKAATGYAVPSHRGQVKRKSLKGERTKNRGTARSAASRA